MVEYPKSIPLRSDPTGRQVITILSTSQIKQYHQQGYLLASGLISEEISEKAETVLWSLLEMRSDQPESWKTVPPHARVQTYRNLIDVTTTEPDLLACCTDEFMQSMAQLLEDPEAIAHRPNGIDTINVFPTNEWSMGKAHIDGIELGGKKHRKTFPGPLRMVVLTFLSDIETQGGGTMVWPRSHRLIRSLAESDGKKYEYLQDLHNGLHVLELEQPIELQPKRGDVLFFQHLFAHAGTTNVTSKPRFAFRYLCTCPACDKWKHSADWNLWTP